MKVWLLPLMAVIVLFLAGCQDALNSDIYKQSCESDKPVPIYCEKFSADDYSKTLTFYIKVVDTVDINYSTIKVTNLDCKRKSLKTNIGYYTMVVSCADFYNQNITGTLQFDYQFMGRPIHTTIDFVRIFGKKDPLLDRQPLNDNNADSNIYGS